MGVRDRNAERRAALTIARKLRHVLKERGMTQADLARLTGLAEATVNRHLIVDQTPAAKKLQRCPTVALLLRYSDALNVPVEDLLGRPQDQRWADPDIQQFFTEVYPRLSSEWRTWCRSTLDMIRRFAAGAEPQPSAARNRALVPALADAQMPPGQFLTDWYSLPEKGETSTEGLTKW